MAKLDCHSHVLEGGLADVEEMDRSQRQDYGYEATNFLSVEAMDDAAQNALAIYFKLLDEGNYAFGGLHHRFPYDFGEEARRLWDLGLDGIKMIENKPTERRRLGIPQNDPRFHSLYAAAAELDIPMLLHVNDPAENWDWDTCPEWSKNAGFFYGDGTYPGYDEILRETCAMLEQNPGVRFCIAHLFFMGDREPELRRLMDRFPNLNLDITAGTEMYYSFDAQPEVWRAFFLDYGDRILFGTDNCYPAGEYDRKIAREINELEQNFLTRSDRFPLWDRTIQGAGLPGPCVEGIMGGNFRRFAGESPRKLDVPKAIRYLSDRLAKPRFGLSPREGEIIRGVLDALEKNREIG